MLSHENNEQSAKHGAIQLYFLRHIHAAVISLDRIIRTPISSLMTICVIGIALAMPAGLNVLLQNVRSLSAGFNKGVQISLYLKKNVATAHIDELVRVIEQNPNVAKVLYISPDEGLKEFQQASGFAGVLDDIKDNPLPAVVVVQPRLKLQSPETITQLQIALRQLPEVEFLQLDMEWVKRLYYFVELGERMVLALFTLFGLGVVLIVWNTIHLSMQSVRQETIILKLVGANNAFIRRPFLYTGLWCGLLGGLPAWYLVNLMLWWLQEPIVHIARSYGSNFYLQNLDIKSGLILLVASMFLGWCGSWLAIARHLRLSCHSRASV
jgi:cell division transport system permease protein